jgi:hypothetical protein
MAEPTPVTATAVDGDHTYKFNVSMSCGGCSGAVNRVLGKLEGMSAFPSSFILPASSSSKLIIPTTPLFRHLDHQCSDHSPSSQSWGNRYPQQRRQTANAMNLQALSPTKSPSTHKPQPSSPSQPSTTRPSSRPSRRRVKRSTLARQMENSRVSRSRLSRYTPD